MKHIHLWGILIHGSVFLGFYIILGGIHTITRIKKAQIH